MPTTKVPMKSSPASRQRAAVISYCAIASAPEILAMGEKKRWAPWGSQSTQLSSSREDALEGVGTGLEDAAGLVPVLGQVEPRSGYAEVGILYDAQKNIAYGLRAVDSAVEVPATEVKLLGDGIEVFFCKWFVGVGVRRLGAIDRSVK